jgi:hypothetical protein
MGNSYHVLVDLDATPADASTWADRALDWLVRERIVAAERTDCGIGARNGYPPDENWAKAVDELDDDWSPGGLNIIVDRRQFGWHGDAWGATCPLCSRQTDFYTEDLADIDGAIEPFDAALEMWRHTGAATVRCRHCDRVSDLAAWTWGGAVALGCLGFEFWGWPDFTAPFIAEFSRALDGHRLAQVWGKV